MVLVAVVATDPCVSPVLDMACDANSAPGMIWTLFYTALYPYLLNSAITKVVPFLDEMFGDER